jgi:hypothetical protein
MNKDEILKSKKNIVLVHESRLGSFINDLITYAFMTGSVWFNHEFCGGSYFLNTVILATFLLFICGKSVGVTRVYSKDLVKLMKESE